MLDHAAMLGFVDMDDWDDEFDVTEEDIKLAQTGSNNEQEQVSHIPANYIEH